ncbi:MAG: cache domain-containing protein [Thermodesulfobacteriota bacterium]
MHDDRSSAPLCRENSGNRRKRFLLFFLPAILLLGSLSVVFYRQESGAREQLLRANEMSLLENQLETLKPTLKAVVGDLKLLAAQQTLHAFLDRGTDDSLRALAADLLAFSTHRRIYDRIRFIDRQGMEIIRINYNAGVPGRVPQDELQYAGNRDYFVNSARLKVGDFSMSPLTLSNERGRITQPPTPVLTCGIAVFDRAGQQRGVIILTCLADRLLQPLKKLSLENRRAIYLVNRQGYFLLGPTPQAEWGFLYPDRKNQTFQARFPAAWERIAAAEKGHISGGAGLFTFLTFYPQLCVLEPSRAFLNADGPCGCYAGQKEDYYWKLVSLVPAASLHDSSAFPLARNLLYLNTLFVVLLAVAAWLPARPAARDSTNKR